MRETTNRTKWLHIRLNEREYKILRSGFSTSTKQQISSYARDILLGKPVTVYTRNKSLDDFVAELIHLRNELKSIGNNINQAVKKMHNSTNENELQYWTKQLHNWREILTQIMEEINLKISKISDQWLQE